MLRGVVCNEKSLNALRILIEIVDAIKLRFPT